MKLRQNRISLDHSTHNNQGYITDCKFNLEGGLLAVGDAHGDACLYSLQNSSEIKCIGEFSTRNVQNQLKNGQKIKSLEWLNFNQQRLSLITNHDDSIKIWKLNSSDIGYSESGYFNKDVQKCYSPSSKLQSQLLQKIDTSCQSIHLSPNQKQILFQTIDSITLYDVEKRTNVYSQTPQNTKGLPVTKRLSHQTRIDYQERIEAELNYWNSLDFITNSKFQNSNSNTIGYSDKLGVINLIDVRIKGKQGTISKLKNIHYNSIVEASLSIPSDFVILENGFEVISRDFLYIYQWDIRNPQNHTNKISVYPSINAQICQLYQEGEIYNRFSLLSDSSGSTIFTNHFQNSFHEINMSQRDNCRYKCSKKDVDIQYISNIHSLPPFHSQPVLKCMDYNQKKDIVATGVTNKLKLFQSIQ